MVLKIFVKFRYWYEYIVNDFEIIASKIIPMFTNEKRGDLSV
jgi:hypothetical protein